jgi:hypothetical protein
MRGLSLYDALDLCELIAKAKPGKYERAAIRWHGRLELEAGTLQLSESMTTPPGAPPRPGTPWIPADRQRPPPLRDRTTVTDWAMHLDSRPPDDDVLEVLAAVTDVAGSD